MKTGNGKIANLPAEIRDELNYRINDGDPGNEIVAWLNSKPEVTEVVNKLFDGTPISEQNLSEWRKRGYQKWLAHHNFVDESNALSDNTGDIAETGIDCDKLLLTLTAAYAEMIRNWIITPGEQMTYKLAVYKNLTNGVLALQRAELQKVRLEIARERLELLREKRSNKSESSASSLVTSTESASREGAASEAIGRGAGGGPGKSRASQEACRSTETACSPESVPGSRQSPSRPDAPEPRRSAIEAPSPTDEADPAHPATAGPFPKLKEIPEGVGSLPAPADAGTASQSAEPQEMGESRDCGVLGGGQEIAEPANPVPSIPTPQTELSAPSSVTANTAPVPAPSIRPSAPVPTAEAQAQTPRTAPTTPPKPASPQNAPLWPTRRPGGPPRNASPRNPLGLL